LVDAQCDEFLQCLFDVRELFQLQRVLFLKARQELFHQAIVAAICPSLECFDLPDDFFWPLET
jgi:hypothetical protein